MREGKRQDAGFLAHVTSISRGGPRELLLVKSRNRNLVFGDDSSFAFDGVVDALGVSMSAGLALTADRVGVDADENAPVSEVPLDFFFLILLISRVIWSC